jgi:hypothetical protein
LHSTLACATLSQTRWQLLCAPADTLSIDRGHLVALCLIESPFGKKEERKEMREIVYSLRL